MRPLPYAILALVVACILAVTLWPNSGPAEALPVSCVFCGQRALADAIANVILFMPLGAALAWVFPGARAPWRLGLALSLAIEISQKLIPGRDPSLGDVITNTIGTQAGWLLVMRTRSLLVPFHHVRARLLSAAAFAATIGVTLWLLGPAPTSANYYGQWTPNLGHLEWYRGRVLAATIDGHSVPVGLLPDDSGVRAFVSSGGVLEVRAIAGPSVTRLASLFSVYDEAQREIVLLGPERDALVLRYRRRAAEWRLDEPDVRGAGLLANVARGDTVQVSVARTLGTVCFTIAGKHRCAPTATPGEAWTLLYYGEWFPHWVTQLLNMLWLAGLAAVVGWYAGLRRDALISAGVVAAAMTLLPLAFGVVTPPLELAAAACGMLCGLILRKAVAV